jgi:hypothetical protein
MEQNLTGINRIISILDEELTELQTAGLYREAEKTRQRLETYLNMRDRERQFLEGFPDNVRRYEGQ